MAALSRDQTYVCPGEHHLISRAVHLSRLTAFHAACRDCSHRSDTGHISSGLLGEIDRAEEQSARKMVFDDQGVRGVYLNQLTPTQAGRIATVFATVFRSATSATRQSAGQVTSAIIVVGYDHRPCSPSLAKAVVSALRRVGCHVIDVGRATDPVVRFAVRQSSATAGIMITGSGHGPSWTGLDFVGRAGVRIAPETLQRIEAALADPPQRFSRTPGEHRILDVLPAYRKGLQRRVGALPESRVSLATSDPLVAEFASDAARDSKCRCELIDLPLRLRRLDDPHDRDMTALRQSVIDRRADLGALIDDGGSRIAVVDRDGLLVPARTLTELAARARREFRVPAEAATEPVDDAISTLSLLVHALHERQSGAFTG